MFKYKAVQVWENFLNKKGLPWKETKKIFYYETNYS